MKVKTRVGKNLPNHFVMTPENVDDCSETLRLLSCEIPSLAYSRPTHVKCLVCGESKKFRDPMTAVDFFYNHYREHGVRTKVEVTVLDVVR